MKWLPNQDISSSNVSPLMEKAKVNTWDELYQYSISHPKKFWHEVLQDMNLCWQEEYSKIYDEKQAVEKVEWLHDARLNIVESCFLADKNQPAIIFGNPKNNSQITYGQLFQEVCKVHESLLEHGLHKGDIIALDLPMHIPAIIIFLAAIKGGITVATIADSFSTEEIKARLAIVKPKLIFTQSFLPAKAQAIPLYARVKEATDVAIVVMDPQKKLNDIRSQDFYWRNFLSEKKETRFSEMLPHDSSIILFSSGTTSAPKTIPWTQLTPIKCAFDGRYHHEIKSGERIAWPTNLGWMMGPWLVFASLINKATIVLSSDPPKTKAFCQFIAQQKVDMLGLVPSMINSWEINHTLKNIDWSGIKRFCSTGEVANPRQSAWLSKVSGNTPVLEYCGGTEIGGGYITSTMTKPIVSGRFNTPTLGTKIVILDEQGNQTKEGEVFIIPPTLGISQELINKDHHAVYYKDAPVISGQQTRRHGDALALDEQGYRVLGRVDDSMNLGGIKVSTAVIESACRDLEGIGQVAAVGIPPKEGGPSALFLFFEPSKTLSEAEEQKLFKDAKAVIKDTVNPLFKLQALIPLASLPRTASGKIMRRRLRELGQNALY